MKYSYHTTSLLISVEHTEFPHFPTYKRKTVLTDKLIAQVKENKMQQSFGLQYHHWHADMKRENQGQQTTYHITLVVSHISVAKTASSPGHSLSATAIRLYTIVLM